MKRISAVAGVAVLGACLAAWSALAWARPGPAQPPSSGEPTLPNGQPVGVPMTPSLPSGSPEAILMPRDYPNPIAANPGLRSNPLVPPPPQQLPTVINQPPLGAGAPLVTTPPPQQQQPTQPEERVDTAPSTEVTPGRQEAAISLEWVCPPTARVGQPCDCLLLVRNAATPVRNVVVTVNIPAGVAVAGAEPRPRGEAGALIWDLGTLTARQEVNVRLRLMPSARGDVLPRATVTFQSMSIACIKVREPKLTLKAIGPEKVLVGDVAAVNLTVTNVGDGPADHVMARAVLSDGLDTPKGNKVEFDMGSLAAGETRSVQVVCGTKQGGPQRLDAEAAGEGGLNARDAVSVNVLVPRLDVQITGPSLRYLDRKALYTLRVSNTGDAPASNVTLADVVPEGFKVLAASDGGRHEASTRTVNWYVGDLGPGQSREIKLEVQAVNVGVHKHRAVVVAARGLKAESEVTTNVEGLSALLLEMVDTEDPIEVGGETAYEIRVTNTGSKTETDIRLVATVPEKMEFKSVQGAVRYRVEGRTIVFEPIDKLAPKADAIIRVNVKALEAGTVRFQLQMTSTNLPEPVIKMEATRIYAD
jgi:uncharacterized repeat protein (TIGR01451 family)